MKNKEVGVRLSVKDEGARRSFKDFGVEGDRALAKIAREGREANVVMREINASVMAARSAFDGIGRLKGGIAGLVTGFVANTTVQTVRNTARAVAEVGDAAKRAGLDVVAFQELKYVAEQNRIGVDQLTDGIKELSLRADEFVTTGGGAAAEAFQRLGYNAERLRDKMKDPSALFSEIIGKLQLLDSAAQIRVMDEISGGSAGEQFVQLIAQGEQGIRDTITAAHDLGTVMSQDLIDKADNVDRKFNQLAATVETGLKTKIVEAADLLAIFIDSFNAIENREYIRPLQNQLAETYNAMQPIKDDIKEWQEALDGGAPNGMALKLDISEAKAKLGELDAQAMLLLERITGLQGADKGYIPPPPKMDGPEGGPKWDEFQKKFAPPKKSGGRSSSANEAERERQKIEGVIQALRDELALIGASETEREVMNQLRRAGVDAASAEGQTIRGLVEQLSREEDAIAKIEDAMESLGGTAKDVLGTMVQGWREGKDAAEIYADIQDSIITKLLSGGIDLGVNALTGWLSGMIKPTSVMGNGVGAGAGGWGNFSSMFGAAHSGWKVGQGNPPQSRHLASLPRMHMGGLSRDEQLIVARRDEGIFTPRQMDNADGLVQALVRNASQAGSKMESLKVEIINPAGDKQVERAEMRRGADGSAIATIVLGAMSENFAGGKMDTMMGALYGVKRIGR